MPSPEEDADLQQATNHKVARSKPAQSQMAAAGDQPRKLSYKEKQELDALPATIERLEQEQREMTEQMGDPDFYRQDKTAIAAVTSRMEAVECVLLSAFERWELLKWLRK